MSILGVLLCINLNIILRLVFGKGFMLAKFNNYCWMLIMIIYTSNLIPFYKINVDIYIYSFIYLISFNAFTILFKREGCIKLDLVTNLGKQFIELTNNINVFLILSVICWIFSIPILKKAVNIMQTYNINVLRTLAFTGSDLYLSTIELQLYQWIVSSLFLSLIIISPLIILSRTKKKCVFIVSTMNAILYCALFAGRTFLLYILLYWIFSLLIIHGFDLFAIIQSHKKIIIFLIIMTIIIGFYASFRISRNNGVIYETLLYYAGGLPFLSQLMLKNQVVAGSLLGRGFFSSIGDLILLLFRIILNVDYTTSIEKINLITQQFLTIGDGIQYNAATSVLYVFISEAGVIGIVIGGGILAYITAKLEDKTIQSNKILWLSLYMYFTYVIYSTPQFYIISSTTFVFNIIFIVFLTKEKRKIQRG